MIRSVSLPAVVAFVCAATLASSAGAARLDLHEASLPLPAAPATVVATDLDRDGRRDLAVFLVYTSWGQKVVEERSEMDGIEGLVEVMTIVPALLDHRELWLFRGQPDGGFHRAGEPLAMPVSVHALAAGPARQGLVALTDDGAAEVVWRGEAGGGLDLQPFLAEPSVLAGSGAFLPRLELVAEVTGDDWEDLLFPARDGIAIVPGGPEGFAATAVARVGLPPVEPSRGRAPTLRYPLPEARDVTGDGLADLVWRDADLGWDRPWIAVGQGEGRFAPARTPRPDGAPEGEPRAVFFGALAKGERAALVTERQQDEPEDAGMRESIRYAESPPTTYGIHPTTAGFAPAPAPARTIAARGYAFAGGGDDGGDGSSLSVELPGGFRDLDGDGREDLVTVSLQISVTRLLGGLALGRVTLPMDFHVWCQRPEGGFSEVVGLDLSGRFRLDLDDLKVTSLPSFAGDFDGDGRMDFVQLGRGKKVTVHTGGPGCAFPARADVTVKLRREPAHLDLVRVDDLDGDGRADLMVIQPGKPGDPETTAPATLDLYVSGGGR